MSLFSWLKKKPICKNCGLYDPKSGLCGVVILHEGERTKLPVEPDDECFYKDIDIQQLRMWCEDKEGNKTDGDGTIKIEASEIFFKD